MQWRRWGSMCVCGGGGGGGGVLSFIYIYTWKFNNILKLNDFEPPKMVWAYYVWKNQSPPPAKYVSIRGNGLSKCFIYMGK